MSKPDRVTIDIRELRERINTVYPDSVEPLALKIRRALIVGLESLEKNKSK